MADMAQDEQREYEVTFVIDTIFATSAEEAAQIVADILADDGYAHRAVYEVAHWDDNNDRQAETIDLSGGQE